MRHSLYLVSAVGSNTLLFASGHGPVFGMTTPTDAKGGWSLDTGIMSRMGAGGSGAMFRTMLGYPSPLNPMLTITNSRFAL